MHRRPREIFMRVREVVASIVPLVAARLSVEWVELVPDPDRFFPPYFLRGEPDRS